jgi:VIT1/CCC1 family predicted Fe2+/Mn2+ transporter
VAGYLLGRLLLGHVVNGFAALVIAFVVSAGFLFGIGAARSFFTGKGAVRSGLEMLVVGSVVASLTYGVGLLFRG